MAIKIVTFEDKQNLTTNENIPRINKVTDDDVNELKDVSNANANNAGDLANLNTSNKNSLVDAINEPLMRVLWENNNVSNMTSGAPINLSSSDYDMILWVYSLSVTNSQNHSISACLKGKNCILDTRTGSSNISVYRLLTYIDDTTYKVGNGYQNAGVNDGNAIPLMAIGIKLY